MQLHNMNLYNVFIININVKEFERSFGTFFELSPKSFTTAQDCAANASFSSNKSTSSSFHPAF